MGSRGLRSLLLGALLAAAATATAGTAAVSAGLAGESGNGTVQVTVVDDRKNPVAGATVRLADGGGREVGARVTDERGVASFERVPAGDALELSVASPGYGGRSLRVAVAAGRTTRVTLPLLGERVETVELVEPLPMVALDTDAQSTTVLGADTFADLPIFGRDYKQALPLAAGVQDSDGDGNPNVHGSRDRDFFLTVDGVSNVDPLTGRALSEINPDSIEEIVILTTGADATYGGAVGGYGRILTKSGGNRFAASGEFRFRDGTFDFDGASGGVTREAQRRQPSLSLSGPILRDRLFFRLDHSYTAIRQPIELTGGTSFVQEYRQWSHSDKLTWNIDSRNRLSLLFRADPAVIEPNDVDSITPPESGSTFSFGGPSATLTWTRPVSPTFFWEATLALTDIDNEVQPYRTGVKNGCLTTSNPYLSFFDDYYCLDQVGFDRQTGTYPVQLKDERRIALFRADAEQFVDQWLGGSHRLQFGAEAQERGYERDTTLSPQLYRSRLPTTGTPSISPGGGNYGANAYTLAVQAFYFPGRGISEGPYTPQQGLNTSLGTNAALYLSDTFEPSGNLSIKIGARLLFERLQADGYTDIDPVADRAAYDAALATCREERCAELCNVSTGTALRCQRCLAAQCASQAPVLMSVHPLDDPMPALEQGGCLVQGVAVNPQTCELLYRGDRESNAFLPEGGLRFRSPESFTISNVDVDPRVSVSWDPLGDNRTRLSASWGRYTQNTYLEPLVVENGPDGLSKFFGLQLDDRGTADFNFGSIYDADLSRSAFSVNVVDRDLEREYADELVVAARREIAPETALQVSYIRRAYRNQLQDVDVNHVPISDEDMRTRWPGSFDTSVMGGDCPTARGDFWDCGGLLVRTPLRDPSGLGGAGYAVTNFPDGLPDLKVLNPLFNGIYRIGNDNESDYRAVSLEFERRFFHSWELYGSYTWSRAEGQAEDFLATLGNDATNADDETGLLSYDQTHVVKLYGRVVVPWFGGLRLGGVGSWQSGLPYSITEARAVVDFPNDPFSGQMDAAGFTKLAPGQSFVTLRTIYPTGQRNDQRNPGWFNFDATVQKEVPFRRGRASANLTVRNLLNDATSQTFVMLRTLTYVRPDGERVYRDTPVSTRREGRQFELALRFTWGG